MRPAITLSVTALWLLFSPTLHGEEAEPDDERFAVRIVSPHSGIVPGPIVELEAIVSDPTVQHATLVVNGASYDVPVEMGRVTQNIISVPGNNRVGLVVTRDGETARDSLAFRYEGEPMELVVLLTWPTEGEIIDLWVREPGGETCKWDHRQTESGGRLLDFSANAIGFGSQGYTLSQVMAGTFRIKIHYWGAQAGDDDRQRYSYDGLIGRWNDLTTALSQADTPQERQSIQSERSELEARLDQWASPAAPQTPVHAEIVLFPGTSSERRWRFDRVVQRTGQLLTLGEIEVTDEMIRAARVDQEGGQ